MGWKRLMREKQDVVSTDDRGTRATNECRAPMGLSSAQGGDNKTRSEKETQDEENKEDGIMQVQIRR